MLCLIDEYTRDALAIRVKRRLNSFDVLVTSADAMISRGTPGHIRSDNGPEFVAKALRGWIAGVGAQTAYIGPGSPWENEPLHGEIFYTPREAEVLIEAWRRHYNTVRPHSSLGYRPPAPEAIVLDRGWPGALAPMRARPASPSLASGPRMN